MATLSLRIGSFFGLLPLAGCLLQSCAGGGGGGGGGGGPVDPPTGPTAFTLQAGLACVAPGAGVLRIDFTPPPSADFEVAVFLGTIRSSLFATTPQVPASGATTLTATGLTDGSRYFIGLGIRPTTGGSYEPIGPVLSATPGAPFYVVPGAPGGGDGLTPATAFGDMFTAALNAFGALLSVPGSSVNVYLQEGIYDILSALPIAGGVNLYGGFGSDFDLGTRDVLNKASVLRVVGGQRGMELANAGGNSLPAVVDGVRITGNGTGQIGIETNSTNPCSMELRSVIITDMADRGIRARNVLDLNFDVVMTSCQSSRNGADGLNGTGAFDYILYNSTFASNFQEGLDISSLVPETGGTATLNARSSRFFGNGAEGLDCTLTLPLNPTFGRYSVQILGCAFERNATAGCLIDGDFELVGGYSADVLVRESFSRGNGGAGFHLDLDGPLDPNERLTALLYRNLATSNGSDGVYVTSESRPGFMTLSGTAMVGNIGAGLRIEGPPGSAGNRTVAATHCLFASNAAGGVISRDVPAMVSSSIAYLQADPFDASTISSNNVASFDPAAIAFQNAPGEYAHVIARSGSALTLTGAPGFPLTSKLELANDGAERAASTIAGSVLTLAEPPQDFGVPGLLAAFAPDAPGVKEDYRLGAGSIAETAGLNGVDAGPFGSPAPGAPGLADEMPQLLFHVLEVTPALTAAIGASATLAIEFSEPLNGSSANAGTVRARRGANAINVLLQTSGSTLTIDPASGNWGPGDFRIELDGLTASSGTALSGGLVLTFQR